jgi:hypothetical protein
MSVQICSAQSKTVSAHSIAVPRPYFDNVLERELTEAKEMAKEIRIKVYNLGEKLDNALGKAISIRDRASKLNDDNFRKAVKFIVNVQEDSNMDLNSFLAHFKEFDPVAEDKKEEQNSECGYGGHEQDRDASATPNDGSWRQPATCCAEIAGRE